MVAGVPTVASDLMAAAVQTADWDCRFAAVGLESVGE